MTKPKVERIDELPIILTWIITMKIHILIDSIWSPSANWQGLSYGKLAVLYVTYVVSSLNHRLSYMEKWVVEHKTVLEKTTGWTIGDKDATDDRLCILLGDLGTDKEKIDDFQTENGKNIIQAYDLPTKIVRYDTTSFNTTHDPDKNKNDMLKFGFSKDHRSDLLQFKLGLGVLDPAGVPILSETLAGNVADDPLYVPAWRKMAETIGHTKFLFIADSKAGALETRATISKEGGSYLIPLPKTGNVPKELKNLVLNAPDELETIHLKDAERVQKDAEKAQKEGKDAEKNPVIGEGFVVEKKMEYKDDNDNEHEWQESWLVSRSDAHAERQKKSLNERIKKAEKALSKLKKTKKETEERFEERANNVLKRYGVSGCIDIKIIKETTQKKCYMKKGRPTKNAPYEMLDIIKLHVEFERNNEIIEEKEKLAGWRIYVSDLPEEKLSVSESVRYYRDEWIVERGMHRFKRGCLPALPLYLRIKERIMGLMLLLMIALQLITTMEFVLRRELEKTNEGLAGLVPGNPARIIDRPTTERLLYQFKTLNYFIDEKGGYLIEELTSLQLRILELLGLTPDIYDLSTENTVF